MFPVTKPYAEVFMQDALSSAHSTELEDFFEVHIKSIMQYSEFQPYFNATQTVLSILETKKLLGSPQLVTLAGLAHSRMSNEDHIACQDLLVGFLLYGALQETTMRQFNSSSPFVQVFHMVSI